MRFIFLSILILLPWSVLSQQHGFVREFDTIDQLIAATNNPNTLHKVYFLKGFNAINDSQGGLIYWNPGDNTPTNSNDILASLYPGAVGRFRWLTMGHVVPPPFSGGVTNYTAITVPTIADLKNVSITNGIQFVDVQGYSTPGDRGQGIFIWDASSVAPDDGGRVIQANNNPTGIGAWIRQIPSPLQGYATEWWGAVLTGTNINNGPISAAINYVNSIGGGTVILPPTDTTIDATQPLYVFDNVEVQGQKGSVIRVADNPSTNYAAFIFNGVTNAALRNVSLVGWNASPPGVPGNTGYGVYVTNSGKITLGGIHYNNDFYTAPLEITKDSYSITVYDEHWVKNSILGYGADPTGVTESTLAVKLALDNTASLSSTNGGRIVWPNGIWAGNFVITNKNIVIDGEAGTVIDSTVSGSKIVPWNTNLYTMVVGADFSGTSVSNQQQGIILNNMRFMDVGPNGQGIGDLHVKAGSYSIHMNDCTFFGGVSNSVLVSCSTNRETIYAIFTRCAMQGADNGEATFHVIGSSVNTAVTILDNCRINGANASGHGMVIDSEQVLCLGSTRLQCASNHGLQFLKTTAPSRTPQVIGKLNIDSNSSSDVLVEIPDNNPYPGAYLVEDIDVDGLYKLANGVILTNTSRAWHRQQSMNLDPLVWGNIFLQDSGTYTNTGPDYRNRLSGGGGGGIWQNDRGGIYLIPSISLVLEQTNGLPTLNLLAIETKNLLTNEIIGVPNPGDTLTINGIVTTWASPVTDPTNQALIGADTGYSATNLYNHFVTYPMHGGGTWSLNFTAPNKVIHQAKYVDIVASSTGTWVTNKVGFKTDNWTHSIYSGEATNLNIRSAGKLWIRDSAGNAIVEVEETARPALVYINTNGFGINRFPTASTLAVDGEVGRVIAPSISSAKTVTNSTPNTFADMELSVSPTPLEPASGTLTNSAGVFHTLYAVGITSPAYTNDLTGAPGLAPIRSEVSHHGSGTISQTVGFYTSDPVNDGGGIISDHSGYYANITAAAGRYAFRGANSAMSRLNGPLGLKNDPAVTLHVNGGFSTQAPLTINVTADNQVITVGDSSYLKLASNSAVATDRTIILSDGLTEGQHLTIEQNGDGGGTYTLELIDNSATSGSGFVRLSSTWTPIINGTLTLIWNGTDWLECSRSAN